jgi:UDP-2,3-diacylglucosamine pyrophosphatase LpxH
VPRDIVIVSDLHLGAHGDSFYELAFSRFLEYLSDSDADLLLLGDALDFLEARPHVTGGRKRVDTSEPAALATLDWIARRHEPFFTALGRFAVGGHRVHIVPGNHDLELLRASARTRFCELVGDASGHPDAAPSIRFHPWIFYVPDLLYAEHGHQYHDINAVDTLLRPEDPDRRDRLALPLASHLVEGWPRFAVHAVRHGVNLATPALARRRAAYRHEVLTPEAASVALDASTLVALDRLSDTRALAILRRLAGQTLRRGASATQCHGYLHRGAAAVDRVLQAGGAGVPYLAFGHTHTAERLPVGTGAEYLNCGTWSPFVPRGLDTAGRRLTFARVSAVEGARVLRWDDVARRPVDLPGG